VSKRWVLADFETKSGTDLKKSGAYFYAACPTTSIMTLAWKDHNGFGAILGPDELLPENNPGLLSLVNDPEVWFIAHNVQFERCIWTNLMVPLGWPEIPIERWHCTMAVSLQKGLPAKLDVVSRVLQLKTQKDMEGHRLTISMSRFDKKTGHSLYDPRHIPRIKQYCGTDIDGEIELLHRVQNFQGGERKVWEMDQRINDRGIRLDTAYIDACVGVVEREMPRLESRFKELTGLKPGQGEKFKGWLSANGLDVPDLTKDTVKKLIGDKEDDEVSLAEWDSWEDEEIYVPPICREALYIRNLAASASIKKLPAMLACQGADGRARGLVQYHGAGPGRWAGRILQPHNFPRASIEIGEDAEGKMKMASPDQIVAAIMEGDNDYIRMIYGEPIEVVASGLRHALVADEGKKLLIADFAQIEARGVLALAGQYDALETFVNGDPYCTMAEAIYKQKVTKKEHPEKRTTGKQTILGAGFGMGKKTFHKRYCPNETIDFAERCINAYRKDLAPLVVELWYGLERASTKAVWDNRPQDFAGITYKMEGEWLTARLHSGRKLFYYAPQKIRKAVPWDKDDIRPGWSHQTYKAGRWIRRDAYGGLLTENIVQAEARDLLVHTMFQCERENLPTVLTVHDENVCEAPEDRAKLFEQVMQETPSWAKELKIPVAIEMMVADRYRK